MSNPESLAASGPATATVTLESHFMLILFRYAVSVTIGVLCIALSVLPGLNAIVAPALLPGALIFAILVALPIAIGLRLNDKRSVKAAIVAGGLLGFAPGLMGVGATVFSIPYMMAVGAVAGLLAWGVAKLQAWLVSLAAIRFRALASFAAALALAALAGGGTLHALALIAGPKDTSCHNISRNGGRSFPVIVSAKLRLEPRDWPRLNAILAEAAATDGWSLRDHTEGKNFGVSLCQEVGTQVWFIQRMGGRSPETSLTIMLTAPQGGQQWRWPADKLLDRLSSEWPNALSFEPWSQVQRPQPSSAPSSAVATPPSAP